MFNRNFIGFEISKEVITNVRKVRKEKNIPNKEKISLLILEHKIIDRNFDPAIIQLCNLDQLDYITEKPENTLSERQ